MSWNYFTRLLAKIWAGHKFPVLIAPVSLCGTPCGLALAVLLAGNPLKFWASTFLLSSAFLLIFVINWLLFRHLITISGKRDTPIEIPAAIVRSGLLLFGLINLYSTVYFSEIGKVDCFQTGFWACAGKEAIQWFYFSTVTFSTLGYGDISPRGDLLAELTASMEALNGLVAFGVFTGALTTYLSKSEA